MTRNGDRLMIVTNVVLVAIVVFTLLRPRGGVGVALREWRQDRAIRNRLTHQWSKIAGEAGRLDHGTGQVLLVEFSDYQCPFCKQAHYRLDSLLAKNPAIGIVYRHFPLPIHPSAAGAARASICAQNQGRFREMDRRLFETTQWQTDTNWVREARAGRVPDISQFRACLSSPKTIARLAADRTIAMELLVGGTPTFFGQGGVRKGVQSVETLIRLAGGDP